MSKKRRDKLLARIKENPKHVTFDELMRLFKMFGSEIKEPRGGSHYKIRLDEHRLTIPRPHGKHVDDVYVKKAISVFEEIIEIEE